MSDGLWFATSTLSELPYETRRLLLNRSASDAADVRSAVTEIIGRVRRDGDAALRALGETHDGVRLDSLEIPGDEWTAAVGRLDGALRRALEHAVKNIAEVHRAFLPQTMEVVTADGVLVGRRPDALDRVGVYAPGGRAAYPSSALMGIVPASLAGVREIVVCSPPSKAGAPPDVVLAAAALGGAHRVFAIGGAGAIAAMAYGTQTVPRVDRIVGPGNAYVAEAKLQVMSAVGIDSPAGPSELLVIADDTADVDVVAREVVAQAEHDPRAAVVVIWTDSALAKACTRAVEALLGEQPRAATIAQALSSRGAMLIAADVGDAVAFASEYAPEHLLLAVRDAGEWVTRVRNAGTVFLGATSSVAFGDYMTGANHVLPTGGLARVYSGLSTHDFVRWTTYQRIDRASAARLAEDTAVFAHAEGLPGHAAAASHWRAV